MAALTPVASAEALLSAIEKSGLLNAESLALARAATKRQSDPKLLAKELVKDGTLTRWQADQLTYGYHRLIVGRYKLLDQLRGTPTGRLYLAEHLQMGRRHTLKLLARKLANNPKAVQRFLIAAQNACRLDHRNISHVYDVNQDRVGHYVVMEHVEGQDLEQIVERLGALQFPQALAYIAQAAEGLAYAHGKGVVHGDLKPANLLLDHSGCIKILEIGQDGAGASPETENPDEAVEMASLAAVIFQAPEMRGDGDTADIPCDVYSLGSILSFLLTGKAAADSAAAAKRLQSVREMPPEAIAFCCGLMSTRPEERPESMDEVLATCIELHQQSAPPEPPPPEPEKPPKVAATQSAVGNAPRDVSPAVGHALRSVPRSAKSPPIAKPLDDIPVRSASEGTPARTASEGSPPGLVAAIEESPTSIPIVIDTHGGTTKRSPGSSGKSTKSKSNLPSKNPAAKPIRTPLILAGAIGGGAALVLVLAVILFFRGRQSPVPSASPKATAAPAATTSIAPITSETAASATATEPPAATPAPPADAKSDLPPPTSGKSPPEGSPPVETVTDATTTPAAPEVAVEPVPVIQPVNLQRRSNPKSKAESATIPFAGFASAVSLPVLPEPNESPLSDTFTPLPLGPCIAGDSEALSIQLLGGDTAIRGGRHKFELLPSEDSNRHWNFQLVGNDQPLTIASLAAENQSLLFQWTENAHQHSPLARQLANGALALGSSKQVAALRTAISGAPLAVDIEKAGAAARWNIGHLPHAKQLFIEVVGVEGFSKLRTDPKEPVNVGDPITLGTGPFDKSPCLFFRLQTSSTANTIDVRLQPTVKLEGWPEPRPYKRKDLMSLQPAANQELTRVSVELKKTKDSRPGTDAGRELRKMSMERLENELLSAALLGDQLKYIVDFMTSTDGEAKIHFRVYSQIAGTKLDLLTTAAPGELN